MKPGLDTVFMERYRRGRQKLTCAREHRKIPRKMYQNVDGNYNGGVWNYE